MNRDAIAIFILLWRRNDGAQRNIFKLADSLEDAPHLTPFNCELMSVVDVLVCASAAVAKIRALRYHAMRGVFLNFHQLCLGELFFLSHDLGRNEFALNGVRNEDSLPLRSTDPFSAECNVFDFQINNAHTNISTERVANANSILTLTFFGHSCFVIFIMAWRLHEHVLRGKIDNRTRGRVTGEIWLSGIDQPLVLELAGDCAPDLAGCELSLENLDPISMTTKPPAPQQRGPAGDITAARTVRVFDVPIEEALAMSRRGETPPEHMANAVYLEWFSERSGRVVIESADYRLQISEPAWRFTKEEIAERDRRIAEEETPFAIAITEDGETQEWDEVRYEQFLRESDALTEKYGRLLEKYADHPDSERIIAREMGWSWLEEALDRQDEEENKQEEHGKDLGAKIDEEKEDESESDIEDYELLPPDPMREGIDWMRDERDHILHPIEKRAHDALHALLDELKAAEHFPEEEDEQLADFVSGFMTLSAKLAGALGGVARGDDFFEPGMVVAWLKRILEILNKTIAAADATRVKDFLPADRLAYYRSELFAIREEVLELIKELRSR